MKAPLTPIGPIGANQPQTGNRTVTDQPGTRKRTEFVVLFFWREPIPSDKLRSMQEGATPGGTGGLGYGNMPMSMPPTTSGPPAGGGGGND
jgi:hypothetical protein